MALLQAMMPAPSWAAERPAGQDPRVIPVASSRRVWNGVVTTPSGAMFACYPSVEGFGPQLQKLTSPDAATPWPDRAWNGWQPGRDFSRAFVHINAIRTGPDGTLWAVDAGAPGLGQAAIPGAARLIGFDVATGRLKRIYDLSGGTVSTSYMNDVRFNAGHAYITDSGSPALLVLDLSTGTVRRVLDHDPSTTDSRPMNVDGRVLRDPQGHELRVHADQIEVSPDGRYVYFQPASGPLARVESRWLDDPSVSAAALAGRVDASWVDTPTSGGTAIDAQGNIYMGDAQNRRILKITPDKTVTVLAADSRFILTDAMWIDPRGYLWIPATQLNRTAGLNGGQSAVEYPVWIYKLFIDARPAGNDHP